VGHSNVERGYDMPKFMKSIQIPVVTIPPTAIVGQVILYGTSSGLSQSTTAGDKNFDVAGTIVPFDFSDSSPVLIGRSQPNLTIGEVVLEIITPFDNALTTITVGDLSDLSRLLSSDSSDPNVSASYISQPNHKYVSETDIYLSISGVNTTGSGIVRIYFN
jgi:hypothetical protein